MVAGSLERSNLVAGNNDAQLDEVMLEFLLIDVPLQHSTSEGCCESLR